MVETEQDQWGVANAEIALSPWHAVALEQALLQAAIDRGDFDLVAIDAALLLHLHDQLTRRALPQLSGWRRVDMAFCGLRLPLWRNLPMKVEQHLRACRLAPPSRSSELLIEGLARLEGGLHALFPFANLCEPTIRLLMRIQLRQLGRPGVLLDRDTTILYLQALWQRRLGCWPWLVPVWRLRLDWHSNKVTALRRG